MVRPAPWAPWAWALGSVAAVAALLAWGLRALGDPWPRILGALWLVGLLVLLALIVIDLVFGQPIGITAGSERALRGFVACFSREPGALWLGWAEEATDLHKALAFLERSAVRGNPEAMREYGRYFLDGGMGIQARGAALPWLRKAAQAGDLEGAFHLADALRWGLGELANRKEARDWYLRSAQGGFRPAAIWLGQEAVHLEEGSAERAEAERWARAAAAMEGPEQARPSLLARLAEAEGGAAGAGPVEILNEVGDALWTMRGYRLLVVGLAVALLVMALLMVLLIPQLTLLALTLLGGLGMVIVLMRVLGHQVQGHSWSGRALEHRAEAGDPAASFELGLRWERGHHDLPRDPEAARRHYARAAEAGHPEACLRLADLLAWGQGGPRDLAGAQRLLERLARTGHPEALVRLQRLAPGLSGTAAAADQAEEGGPP